MYEILLCNKIMCAFNFLLGKFAIGNYYKLIQYSDVIEKYQYINSSLMDLKKFRDLIVVILNTVVKLSSI